MYPDTSIWRRCPTIVARFYEYISVLIDAHTFMMRKGTYVTAADTLPSLTDISESVLVAALD